MIDKKDITGIILAGGKSSRMGTDKGFLKLNKKHFVQYSIEALQPLVSDIIIVSDNSDYDAFGYKRVNDIVKHAGPVSGIYSGLEASKTEYNLVLSCDIPLINSKLLQTLIKGIDSSSDVIQIESNGKTMPLIALYKKQCKDTFYKLLESGERRLRIVVNNCHVKNISLDLEDDIYTKNINTKEELKQIENVHNH
ncbi:molybdenum cofactor guanylyltransferase [Flaviramulus sp. BrNp1-15]|uniref:molybdenum cofactor guanylyltransferase n=1 Tax=Flaviramulus sp. BrNp1-15 TaxID=2916754 RepID=UPI001EE92596|nr:molybdenum cofactor guanylyltransferase [Flaviramulus sp. BrNp1-15]ULC58496.1 molybdenum cofactor guanylyltransferase [Flaviramulus sp. BrNp1-15]